jgi:hypothetical protein
MNTNGLSDIAPDLQTSADCSIAENINCRFSNPSRTASLISQKQELLQSHAEGQVQCRDHVHLRAQIR